MSEAVAQIKQTAPVEPDTASHPIITSAPDPQALVEADLLVEDVSIDGMCGVY